MAGGGRPLDMNLREGWNMISINVDPVQFYRDNEERGPDPTLMFAPIVESEQFIQLKNSTGQFWSPENNFSNIPFWNLEEGYLVNLSEAVDYEITGYPISVDRNITLHPGWNMISYIPDYNLDASAPDFYVLSPIIDRVLLAKDENGRFMNPSMRFSNMGTWTPGKGYQVKINARENIVFNYPEEE